MINNILVYIGYILEIEIIFGISFFIWILNVLPSIVYSFKFMFGSNNTHNPKYHKKNAFDIYVGFESVQIYFYLIGFGLFVQPYPWLPARHMRYIIYENTHLSRTLTHII